MQKLKTNRTKDPALINLENKLLDGDAAYVETSIENYRMIHRIKDKTKINEKYARYLKLLSVAQKEQGHFEDAEKNTLKLIKYFEEKNQEEDCADCYLNLAMICLHVTRYSESIDNLEKAAKIFENLNITDKIAGCERSLGKIYYFLEFYDEAYKRAIHAQAIYETAQSNANGNELQKKRIDLGLISCKYLFGIIKLDDPNRNGALEELLEAEKAAKASNKVRLLGHIYQDLARCYLSDAYNKVDEAEKYLEKSKGIRIALGDKKGYVMCLLYDGLIKSRWSNWKRAILCYTNAIEQANGIKSLDILIIAYYKLYEAYKSSDNLAGSINAIEQFHSLEKLAYQKKHTNRVKFEQLLSLNDEIKNLKVKQSALENEKSELKATLKSTADFLQQVLPPGSNGTKKIIFPQLSIQEFNLLRTGLVSLDIKSIDGGLEILKKALTPERKKEVSIWREDIKYISHFYNKLLSLKLISETDHDGFQLTILYPKNPKAKKIKWMGKQFQLAYLFFYLFHSELLDKDFYLNYIDAISDRFVSKKETEIASIDNDFSSCGIGLKGDKKTDRVNEAYELIKLPVEERINAIVDLISKIKKTPADKTKNKTLKDP
ncbi:MAG: tetratricopeptide repeat protein [Bacteroidota bacterium]